ncbi:hypothetical protein [Hymenobacter frigidus]
MADYIVLLRGTASPEFTVTSYAALNSRQFRVYEHQLSLYVPSRVALVLARAQ